MYEAPDDQLVDMGEFSRPGGPAEQFPLDLGELGMPGGTWPEGPIDE
jgi:hypothetical protein